MSDNFIPNFDLLLKGGRVLDPANGIDDNLDVGISGMVIGAVEKDIASSRSLRTVDVTGLIVSPGLIDLHAHFWGYEWSIKPDELCLASGVTTAVDAGGSGYLTFDEFNEKVISKSKVRIFALLNIAALGMTGEPEQDLEGMSVEFSLQKILQRPDLLIGVKVAHYLGPGWEPLDRAVEVARNSKTFVMVDQNPVESRPMEQMLLEHMDPGDVVTHCYGSGKNMIDFADDVYPYFFAARDRGIKFDVGHGAGSFSWRVAQSSIDQGFFPDTISTDLHSLSYLNNQATMPETMSKLLLCGIPIQDVFKMSTIDPAKHIGLPALGSLTISSIADVAVFKLSEGNFGFTDNGKSGSRVRNGNLRLEPEITIKDGMVFWDRNGRTKSDWHQTASISSPHI
ncbi:MAG: amidohydrolase family protein [SAR202 cluster bacterium]|nr:amidohydrolase family protein [SAR202 cluster bacterium]|tara:strand:- start:4997 stop:6184 length:1188 start_codon:yes stop_codon:yes gene_type:complete